MKCACIIRLVKKVIGIVGNGSVIPQGMTKKHDEKSVAKKNVATNKVIKPADRRKAR